ncbi:MAG: hypothetical protein K9H15_15370 [Bacteroidales bacterium]|nr:hypothetical protein [Bacteroidales bacterium]
MLTQIITHRVRAVIIIIFFTLFLFYSCEEEPPEPPDFSSKIAVTTGEVSGITYRSARASGTLSETYGQQVSDYGHCWDTLASPTVQDSKTALGSVKAGKTFDSALEDLELDKKYYVRAYFLIDNIAVYGNELSFITLDGKPALTTSAATNITASSATTGGSITDDGGVAITARGVCWNTSGSPTTANSKTNDGSGTGSFSSSLSGLTENTTYYVRAYATNATGTSYGDEITFTTKDGIAVLTTTAVTNITASSATTGGSITDDGGVAITARGVCWNTSGSPTTADSKTSDGSGTGSFTSSITGLSENTTYYVRTYATNSYGTGYGQEVQFTTGGPVTDYDGNTYETVTLGNQTWMAENLNVTHYPDGTAIPHVTDNSAWGSLADNNTDDAYCYYNNNSSSEYSALYTYAAALNACPDGWHLPSDAEWTELENYLANNGYNYDGTTGGGRDKIAKAMATASGWSSSSTTGAVGNSDYPEKRNASGFSSLPGGRRSSSHGAFVSAGDIGYWWSSTESSSTGAYYRSLGYDYADVGRSYDNKSSGSSVRCVRDD